jgi:hypothetical protein
MNNSDVKKITIVVNTGISKTDKEIFVTKHIFDGSGNSYNDPYYEDYPFFTNIVKIPKDELRRRTFHEKINFFFNRRTFIDTLSKYSENSEIINDDILNENAKYNLETMVELLFTSVYPSINDNSNSFDEFIVKRNTYNITMDGSVPKMFNRFIPYLNVDFSYLKLDGEHFTVTSTCILNDILNHPNYKILLNKLTKFTKWKTDTSKKIKSNVTNIVKQINHHINERYRDVYQVINEIEKNASRKNYNDSSRIKEIAERLNALFNDFRKHYNSHSNPVNSLTSNLVNILRQIKSRIDGRSFNELRGLVDEFLIIDVIHTNYFGSTISKKYEVISKEVEKFFNQNFSEYKVMQDVIKQFMSPNCQTNNQKLQTMINDYHINENDVFEKYMIYVFDKYINDDKPIVVFPHELTTTYGIQDSNVIDLLNTGINYYDSEKKNRFEAHVKFNLIKGKLSYDDTQNISCSFKDEQLGEMVYKKKYETKNSFLSPKPVVINIDDMLNKNNNENKNKKKDIGEKRGGKSKYKRNRNKRKKNKTIKCKK